MPKFLSSIQTADQIDDSTSTKKLVTQTEKNTWDAKQATLVSGTNIKTVNGSSILGSGDLVVAGGAASVTSVNTRTGAVVLTAADVGALSNTTGAWILDSQGNSRIFLGASTDTANQFIFRASNTAGTFQVRDSADTTRFAVNMANGEVTVGTVPWARLTSVPTTFTPAAHTHAIADTTGLQTALDARSLTSHTHANLLPLSGGRMTGDLFLNTALVMHVGASFAHQRVDSRPEGIEARGHWYGVDSSGGTRNFKHAWFDGSAYVNIDVVSQNVRINNNPIWHTGNFNPASYLALSGGDMTGILVGRSNTSGGIAVGDRGNPSFEVLSNSTSAAFITFHRAGNWAVRFGLDTDNQLKIGGWSLGAVAHTVWHSGNFQTLSAGNGFAATSGPFNGSIARTWTIGGGTGITINADGVALTNIISGSATVGAVSYNGTGASSGRMNGGTSMNNLSGEVIRLNYSGQLTATGVRWGVNGGSALSDELVKYDVENIDDDFILKLRPVSFRYHSDGRDLQYGLIAQEVEEIVGDNIAMIKKPSGDNYFYGLDYTQLIAPMIATIQSLEKRIKELEKREVII